MDDATRAVLIERLEELRFQDAEQLGMTLAHLMVHVTETHVGENQINRNHLYEFRKQGLDLATKFKQGELTAGHLADAIADVVPSVANTDFVDWPELLKSLPDATTIAAWADKGQPMPIAWGLFNMPDLPDPKVPDSWRTAAEYLAELPLLPLRALNYAGRTIREAGSQAVDSTAEWVRKKLISDEEIELAKIGVGVSAVGVLYAILKE